MENYGIQMAQGTLKRVVVLRLKPGTDVLLGLTMKHELHYHWVKGHADNPMNNRCDELAVAEWKKFKM